MKAKRQLRVWRGWIVLYPADAEGPDLYEGQQGEGRGAIPTVYKTREEALFLTGDGAIAIRVEIREVK